MPPARPPNLLREERSLHLTHSAQRLQERDYRRCARNTPKKKYPHFLPIQRRCCPTQGFLVSHTSTCLPKQEKSHCSTEESFPQPPCANRSRQMLLLFRPRCRAEFDQLTHQGPLALSSEELAMWPILPWDVPMRGDCTQTHAVPRIQIGPNTFHIGVSHIFGTMPEPSRPQAIDSQFHEKSRANTHL